MVEVKRVYSIQALLQPELAQLKAGLEGQSPAPCGPQEPAVSQVLHPQMRWERWNPGSIVLHPRAAEKLV